MDYLENYRNIMKALPARFSEAEVDAERNASTVIKCANGEIIETRSSDTTELFIRVSDEKTGYAYTQDLEEEPIEVLLKGLNNSNFVQRQQKDKLNESTVKRAEMVDDRSGRPDLESMKLAAEKLEKTVRESDGNISSVAIEICSDTHWRNVINSNGLDVESSMNLYSVRATVMAEKDGDQYDATFFQSVSDIGGLNVDRFRERIAASLRNQYGATELRSGVYPVLLDSTVVTNIMMTAWQMFSGMKYNNGSSALSGKLGETIGSSALSITDSPSHELTGYHYEFDCEGTPSEKQRLVENGKLVGLMHNISSATGLDTSSTGNAGRYALLSGSIPTDIIITPKIFYIEPGENSLEVMEKEIDDGVYITHSYDVFHSINIGSGSFSIPCRGTVIKNGKPGHNVTGLTINGRLTDLFARVKAAGNDLYIEEFLRKSYCVGAPSILVERLQINGK
ncbi:MAG: TldD/PmbA family protein [Mesotoga sp.]|uniref:TldD/PmbA family protein n=1 Tax=Mesotoga sp. TaxID=2053577 RepID=UPI0016B3C10E|nr:TldD/PmbA family protein [Mesotoga sp.]NLT44109.1 TldD/PmbA family protein [Thermotogaceae bacterium]